MFCCYEFIKTFSVFVVGIQLIFGVLRWVYWNVIGPKFLEPANIRQYGNWALVTGATDGIGKQYARSLAKRGLNIILVARTPTKLEEVAKEISETFNVQTQVIAVNFTSGPEIYDQIKQQIVGKDVGILVNNVGMFQPAPDCFLDIPDRDRVVQDIVRCNVASVPMMCSVILPQMVQRKRGLIINISSLASVIPGPPMIATNMNRVDGGTFTVPTASQYVESALSYVGYARHTTGFLPHSLMAISAQFMNFIAPSFAEGLIKKQMLAVRDKAIKRGSYKPVVKQE